MVNKYIKKIRKFHPESGSRIQFCLDVYDVLSAFEVRCPGLQHAIKKLLMPGERGVKTYDTDLKEAMESIQRARELAAMQHGQDLPEPKDKSDAKLSKAAQEIIDKTAHDNYTDP